MRIEFYLDEGEFLTPIEVANTLINHSTHMKGNFSALLDTDFKTFGTEDLEQIAEHLLVYCKYNKEERKYESYNYKENSY